MLLLIRAETRAGVRYELDTLDTDDRETARRRAIRAAELLAVGNNRGRWIGSRVNVVDAASGRLVYAVRIVQREDARHA